MFHTLYGIPSMGHRQARAWAIDVNSIDGAMTKEHDDEEKLRATVAENFELLRARLADQRGAPMGNKALGLKLGLSNGTVDRLRHGSVNNTLVTVAAVARYFEIEPWQVLAPQLGANLHTLEGAQIVPVITLPKEKPTLGDLKRTIAGRDEPQKVRVVRTGRAGQRKRGSR